MAVSRAVDCGRARSDLYGVMSYRSRGGGGRGLPIGVRGPRSGGPNALDSAGDIG